MNKEIIKEAYEIGIKWQGVLMACYSKEVFTRDYIEDLVKEYHASKTAINSNIDRLLEHDYISKIGTRTEKPKKTIYTVTDKGEKELYNKFPGLSYRMATILDGAQPEDIHVDVEIEIDSSQDKISKECDRIKEILLDKNQRYGNSSLQPSGVFTSVKRESKIEARIDDKLARIKNYATKGDKHNKDYYDAIDDLIGYLILYRIALRG